MKLPPMKFQETNRKRTDLAFAGLNRAGGMATDNITDMRNMTCDGYPALQTRRRRKTMAVSFTSPRGMGCFGADFYVDDGGKLYRCTERVSYSLMGGTASETVSKELIYTSTNTSSKRQMACIAGYLVVYPDKIAVDNTYTVHPLVKEQSFTAGTVSFAAGSMNIGNAWLDDAFHEGDLLTVSGCTTHPENNVTAILRGWDGAEGTLTFDDNLFTAGNEAGAVKLKRDVPNLDFITACDNRIFGCKGDTVYVSKLGDPFNFAVFDGLVTDSWQATVGTPGSFTAAACYGGRPVFFKEHSITRLYGSDPSEYTFSTVEALGVQKNSAASVAEANGALYWLSPQGVVQYRGGTPALIGNHMGDWRLQYGSAAADGLKYYLSAQFAGATHLLVYDTRRGVWSMEDDTQINGYGRSVKCGGMMVLTGNGKLQLISEYGAETALVNDTFTWYCEWENLYETDGSARNVANKHTLCGLQVRLTVPAGCTAEIKTSENGGAYASRWESGTAGVDGAVYIPVAHRRCDRYGLRISGTGQARIDSVTRIYRIGSAF